MAALAAGATTIGAVSAQGPSTAMAASPASTTGGAVTTPRPKAVAALKTRAVKHVRSGRSSRVRGRLLPASKGVRVALEVRVRRGWKTVDRATTRANGRFSASWRPRKVGRYRMRVRSASSPVAPAATAKSWRVYAYRAGHASWYGPGLYGNTLGCGGTLTPGTVGVANKSLPCGTKVTFRYRGRSVTARVVDRGPYVGGREWDLTAALKRKLGFGSTGTVWSTR